MKPRQGKILSLGPQLEPAVLKQKVPVIARGSPASDHLGKKSSKPMVLSGWWAKIWQLPISHGHKPVHKYPGLVHGGLIHPGIIIPHECLGLLMGLRERVCWLLRKHKGGVGKTHTYSLQVIGQVYPYHRLLKHVLVQSWAESDSKVETEWERRWRKDRDTKPFVSF